MLFGTNKIHTVVVTERPGMSSEFPWGFSGE